MMHLRLLPASVLLAGILTAQQPPGTDQAANAAAELKEMNELGSAVSEAGQSTVDRIRVFEQHLKKYPESKQRTSLERNLASLAMEADDKERIILYGEKVLAMGGADDLKLLDRVTFALADSGNPPARLKRAVEYAKRYEKAAADWRTREVTGGYTLSQYLEELDRITARALAMRARATGQLGNAEEAAQLSMQSWQAFPTGEGARECGSWMAKLGRNTEAIECYANAFTLEDGRTTQADRQHDRATLGALYTAANGSEKGLGDVILSAYDRASALLLQRRAQDQAKDPNGLAVKLLDFTLPAFEGPPVALASLKGKTIVMDFWATWCVPCRAQRPMIQNVKKHFGDAQDLVFLAVSTDEDHSLVGLFLKQVDWGTSDIYFDAGLAVHMNIASIPTVLVVDPAGHIASRMAGFIPERFEEMLTARITEARQSK
jgi:thiol-disulfide isomerase/thioredoxin